MQIYVDADACPVVDIVEKIAYTDFRLQRGGGRGSRGGCSGL